MNNWCICWLFTHLIFKGISARRLCKSFGVKGLIVTGYISAGMKRPRRRHATRSRTEVKNKVSYNFKTLSPSWCAQRKPNTCLGTCLTHVKHLSMKTRNGD
jgi:predicted methyltransferase